MKQGSYERQLNHELDEQEKRIESAVFVSAQAAKDAAMAVVEEAS